MTLAVLSAVVVAGATVRREFFPSVAPGSASVIPVQVKGWKRFAAIGHRMGSPAAPVTILEFADFECPVCRTFTNGALRYIRTKYRDSVQIVFRHWPLSYHRFAYPTARAAECAGAQGRFEQFHDLIYAKQDSLGLKPYTAFAVDVGVPDLAEFGRCISVPGQVPAIEADIKAAAEVGGGGTPTILVNGLRLAGAPDSATLEQRVKSALRSERKAGAD